MANVIGQKGVILVATARAPGSAAAHHANMTGVNNSSSDATQRILTTGSALYAT